MKTTKIIYITTTVTPPQGSPNTRSGVALDQRSG